MEDARNCRLLAMDYLSVDATGSFSEARRILQKKSAALLRMDKTFGLELHFLEHVDGILAKAALDEVFKIQPATTKTVTLAGASIALATLSNSPLFKQARGASLKTLMSVKEVIGGMIANKSPSSTLSDTEGYAKLLVACGNFWSWPTRPKKNGKPQVPNGKESLIDYLTYLDKLVNEKTVKVVDIEKTRPFWYLLTPPQLEKVISLFRNM